MIWYSLACSFKDLSATDIQLLKCLFFTKSLSLPLAGIFFCQIRKCSAKAVCKLFQSGKFHRPGRFSGPVGQSFYSKHLRNLFVILFGETDRKKTFRFRDQRFDINSFASF